MPTSRRAPPNRRVDLFHCVGGTPSGPAYATNLPARLVTSSQFTHAYGLVVLPTGYLTMYDLGLTGPAYAVAGHVLQGDLRVTDQIAIVPGGPVTHFVTAVELFFPLSAAIYQRVWIAPLPLP